MTFKEYVDRRSAEQGQPRTTLLKEIARRSGVSVSTLRNAYQGMKIAMYPLAVAVATVTGNEVTANELVQ